jgi:hypothetical protein
MTPDQLRQVREALDSCGGSDYCTRFGQCYDKKAVDAALALIDADLAGAQIHSGHSAASASEAPTAPKYRHVSYACPQCYWSLDTEGWATVPLEPDTKMIDAAIMNSNEWARGTTDFASTYRAMLAAAPSRRSSGGLQAPNEHESQSIQGEKE